MFRSCYKKSRSENNNDDSNDFKARMKEKEDDKYLLRHIGYHCEIWKILKPYEEEKKPSFVEHVIYTGQFFQHIYDNLDIIKDPRFYKNDPSKDHDKAVLYKITMWNNDKKELENFMLTEDNIDHSLLQSSIANTDNIVKLVIDAGIVY